MLRTNDRESEILLGNKQLLGIFFAVALLLGVAFYGGYMVGRSSSTKKVVAGPETAAAPASTSPGVAAGETHTIPGESGSSTEENRSSGEREPVIKSNPGSHELAGSGSSDVALGSRKTTKSTAAHEAKIPAAADSDVSRGYLPQPGSQYLQVVALARSEAEGLADVLHKKGFRAHAVPKPGNASVYRVIVGPIRDAGDLSSTRDALRKTGFREVIVQRY
jgi:cell division septation protein DedD